LPVGEALLQAPAEVDAEAGWEVSSLIAEAQFPGGLDQEGQALLELVVLEPKACFANRTDADAFHVVHFVQSELRIEQQRLES